MDHLRGRPHRESTRPIKYNPVPIGGPDRPPVTQSPSPGTIFASPSGDVDADGDADGEGNVDVDVDVDGNGEGDGDGDKDGRPGPVKGDANGAPKRELDSPNIKREPDLRDGSEYQPDRARSSIATRRSSTAYPDVINEDTRSEDADGEPRKKRQKRNKPTLSCFECVERKTKVGSYTLLALFYACHDQVHPSRPHICVSTRACYYHIFCDRTERAGNTHPVMINADLTSVRPRETSLLGLHKKTDRVQICPRRQSSRGDVSISFQRPAHDQATQEEARAIGTDQVAHPQHC